MIRHAPSIGLGLGLSLRSDTLGAPGLLDLYGGAAAAYSLRALRRGWIGGDVVEVRRSSDSTTQDFTASQITNGQMLSWVNTDPDPYSSDFSTAGRDGFDTGIRSTTTSNIDSIGGLDDNFRIVDSIDVSTSHYTQRASFTVGFSYSVTMDIYLPSSNSILDGFVVGENTDTDSIYDGLTGFPTDTWTSISGTTTTTGDKLRISCAGGGTPSYTGNGTDAIYVRNITVTQLTADGFVSTWYDQSGNANNATQIAAASQPKIVDAGALVVGGLDFDGVDDFLGLTGTGLDIFKNVGYGQVFSVATSDETGLATGRIFELSSGAANARYIISDSNVTAGSYRIGGRRLDADSFDSTTSSAVHGATEKLLTGFLNWADAEAYLYQNGANVGTDLSFQTTGNTEDTSSTGANNGIGSVRFDGRIREVLIYNTNQMANRVGIETNINDHYSIY